MTVEKNSDPAPSGARIQQGPNAVGGSSGQGANASVFGSVGNTPRYASCFPAEAPKRGGQPQAIWEYPVGDSKLPRLMR